MVEKICDTELIIPLKIYIPVNYSLTLTAMLTIGGIQIFGAQDYDVNASNSSSPDHWMDVALII